MNSRIKLRPSDNTLKNYLDYIADAFLFSKARRFDIKGKRYIDSPSKFYATDLGLRNAWINFRDTDRSHPMENAIFNELVRRGYNVDVGVVPIASRTDGQQTLRNHEIDFVVNRGNDKLYIQSALRMDTDDKRAQELRPLVAQERRFLPQDRHYGRVRPALLRQWWHLTCWCHHISYRRTVAGRPFYNLIISPTIIP